MEEKKNQRIFINPDKISKHLSCSICLQVFDNPNRLSCGHTFCYFCIERWANQSKLCPLCKNTLRQRKPQKDLIAASLIDQLQAKCYHKNCQWTGIYSILKTHQRKCIHRPEKIFQNPSNQIVEVNDSEIEEKEQNKPKKKIKSNQDDQQLNIPMFQASQQQQKMQLTNSNQNSSSNSNSHSYSSSSSNNSLQLTMQAQLQLQIQRRRHSSQRILNRPKQKQPEIQAQKKQQSNPFIQSDQEVICLDSSIQLQRQMSVSQRESGELSPNRYKRSHRRIREVPAKYNLVLMPSDIDRKD